jgi:tyrosine-protein phosphatase SIW14
MTLPSTSPPLVPPINFSLVAPGVYRSGHPNKKNFGFLRRLKLRGIMYLEGTDEYRKDSMDFVEEEGVVLHRFDLSKEAVSASAERVGSWYQ